MSPLFPLLPALPALPAAPRCSPLSAAEHSFYNRPLKLGPALIPSHSVCLVIGSCCSEGIFTLSGDQWGVAASSGEQRGKRRQYPMNPRVRFLSRCSALCEMQAGAKFTHILELTFKRQIFMIFIVDNFCKKGFLKIEKILIRGQSF